MCFSWKCEIFLTIKHSCKVYKQGHKSALNEEMKMTWSLLHMIAGYCLCLRHMNQSCTTQGRGFKLDLSGCILTRLMGEKHAMMWRIVILLSESKLGRPLDLLPIHKTHTQRHTKTYNIQFMFTDVQTRWDWVKLSRILYKKCGTSNAL